MQLFFEARQIENFKVDIKKKKTKTLWLCLLVGFVFYFEKWNVTMKDNDNRTNIDMSNIKIYKMKTVRE